MVPSLTPAVLHILLALTGGERHGYGIAQDIRAHTNGDVQLGPGTIYGTIRRLMEAGWIEETDGPAHAVDARRRHYRLTSAGRKALEEDLQRMEALVRLARTPRRIRALRG